MAEEILRISYWIGSFDELSVRMATAMRILHDLEPRTTEKTASISSAQVVRLCRSQATCPVVSAPGERVGHLFQGIEPEGVLVEAGDLPEIRTARGDE